MNRMVWIDPPDGWRWGFPKKTWLSTVQNETLFRIWLAENNYPNYDIDFAMKWYRYWNVESD
jgi:hypothetical protein